MKKIITDLLAIFKGSVTPVIPDKIIRSSLRYSTSEQILYVLGDNYDLANKKVYIVGAGKAVEHMAKETENILGNKLHKGIISIPIGSSQDTQSEKVKCYEGAENNMPDANSENTAKKILNLVSKLTSKDLLIVLLSGGGSALLPIPRQTSNLNEKIRLIKALANAGADIKELNIVRKKISNIKGGKLAIAAQPAKVVTLVLSDIVGDPLDLIASGPTVENTNKHDEAINVVNKYNLLNGLPDSLLNLLHSNDAQQNFPHDNVKNYIIGSNKMSLAAACDLAKDIGLMPIIVSDTVTGNVIDVSDNYVKIAELVCRILKGQVKTNSAAVLESLYVPGLNTEIFDDIQVTDKPICLIFGGETTVQVTGKGKGGRNQHLALEFSNRLDKIKKEFTDFQVYILCAGTDGIDGPTDAAGAIGYGDLVADARKENENVEQYLFNNDSYSFYSKFKNGALHIVTGHTGTNVMDVHLIVIQHKGKCHV